MSRIVKKPEDRRREIVAKAWEFFQRKDYEQTTMQDIMTELGIAKGTIYHYFASKEALLEAVVESVVEGYIEHIKAGLAGFEGNALKKISALISLGNVETAQEQTLEDLHRPGNVALHARMFAVTILKLAPLYESVIRQGNAEGIVQVDHPLECSEFLLAGIQFLTDTGIYPWKQEDLIRRAGTLGALVEVQLKAPKGSFDFLSNQN